MEKGQQGGSMLGKVKVMQHLKADRFHMPDLRHTASTWHRTYTWSECVQLCHQSQHQERGTVGISFPQR